MTDEPTTTDPQVYYPPKIMVDGKGFYWRVIPPDGVGTHETMLSMCPTNPDNSPVPLPLTYYVPESEAESLREQLREAQAQVAALTEFIERLRVTNPSAVEWHERALQPQTEGSPQADTAPSEGES